MRSLRNRLALIFFAIMLISIAGIYLYVAPQLQTSLRDEKLRALASAANTHSGPLSQSIGSDVDRAGVLRAVRQAADRSSARVSLFGVSRGTQGLQLYPIADSTARGEASGTEFPLGLAAARSGRVMVGSGPTRTGEIGVAARPLWFGGRVARVVVFSTPLAEVSRSVALVRREIAIAGALSLAFALGASFLVARGLSQRLRRLERAAGDVAAGSFSPIPVDSDDELGQLARTFNEMQGKLAQLDDARRRFIATASHELRTPIFSLGGFVELLQDEDLDEETRDQFLTHVREQTGRLRRLSTELLDLSKLEAGSLEFALQPCDVAALARDVTAEFIPALARHDAHLELRLHRGQVRAVCDHDRVAQILRILIDNALNHTPSGTRLYVSVARQDGHVNVGVRDAGMGIGADVLPRIFEPFFTSNDAQGSGLGLTIARELAEQMDGHLSVESAPGRTVFTLELPV